MTSASKRHLHFRTLLLLALILGAIAVAPSNELLPQVPLVAALLYALAGIVAFLAIATSCLVVASRINAYVLKRGEADTQWLWFKSDPQGLMHIREEARIESDDALQEPEPEVRSRGL